MHKASRLALAVTLMFVGNGLPKVAAQGGPPRSLPDQASQVAQGIVEFDGELEVQYEDSAAGARLLHFLNTGSRRLQLRFADAPLDWQSGTRVKVRGRLLDANTLALASSRDVQMLSLPTVNTFGAQNTLVMLINFSDNASQPYAPSSAFTTTFETTSNYYLENSYQQTFLTGAVYGWFTISANSSTCAYDTWASLADQAAQHAGANLANFPRRIYGFPNTAACSWWGLGSVGGNPSRAWINGDYTLKVVGHEFGHNLGEYHSHSRPCEPAGCTTVEYGDDHDIMGLTSSGHLNAFQKERLGWLNYGNSPAIQTITQSGDYHVNAMEPTGPGPKGLKIPVATDGSGLRTYYYIEAQTGAGFDSGNVAWRARAQRVRGVRRQQLSDRSRPIDVELRCDARPRPDVHRCGGRRDDHGRWRGCERGDGHDCRDGTGVRAGRAHGDDVAGHDGVGGSRCGGALHGDRAQQRQLDMRRVDVWLELARAERLDWHVRRCGAVAQSWSVRQHIDDGHFIVRRRAVSTRSRLARCARARADRPPDRSTSSRRSASRWPQTASRAANTRCRRRFVQTVRPQLA